MSGKGPRRFSKDWLLSLTSPIRWGVFAALLAVLLFSFEIFLSLIQLYESLFGFGGWIMGAAVQVMLFIGICLFVVFFIAMLILFIRSMCIWNKEHRQDNTSKLVSDNNARLKRIEDLLKRKRKGEE